MIRPIRALTKTIGILLVLLVLIFLLFGNIRFIGNNTTPTVVTDQNNRETTKGEDGENGKDGQDGEDGRDGNDGTDGRDGEDGKDGPVPQLANESILLSHLKTVNVAQDEQCLTYEASEGLLEWESCLEQATTVSISSVPRWESDTSGGVYDTGDIINHGGHLYKNKTGTNTDTDPLTDLVNWELFAAAEIDSVPLWQSLTDGGDYQFNDIINYSGGFYRNLTGNNTDNNPASDTTNWVSFASDADSVPLWQSLTNGGDYQANDIVNFGGILYRNLTSGNTDIDPLSDATNWIYHSAQILTDLTDVNTATATAGNLLIADGTEWESVAANGDALIDETGLITIQDNSVDGTDIAFGLDALGDITYYDGTDWVALTAGTEGQIIAIGAGGIPEWVDQINSVPRWESATDGGVYIANDIVNHEGVLYKNLTGVNTDVVPNLNDTDWELVVPGAAKHVYITQNFGTAVFPADYTIAADPGETTTYYHEGQSDYGALEFDVRLIPPGGVTMYVDGEDTGEFLIKGNDRLGNNATVHINNAGTEAHVISTGGSFTGAASATDGSLGLVPAPIASTQNRFLRADGTWDDVVEYTSSAGNAGITPSAEGVYRSTNTGGATFTLSTTGIPAGRKALFINDGTGNLNLTPITGQSVVLPGEHLTAYFRNGGWRAVVDVEYTEPVYSAKINSAGTTLRTVHNNTGGTVTTSVVSSQIYINVTGGAFPTNAVGQVTIFGFNSGIGYMPHFYQDSTTQLRVSVTKQEGSVTTSGFMRDIMITVW